VKIYRIDNMGKIYKTHIGGYAFVRYKGGIGFHLDRRSYTGYSNVSYGVTVVVEQTW
jgi:hypothetical protein